MFNYAFYSVDEFLKDEWFREWVLNPSPPSDAFWNEWLRLHPDRQASVDQARALLRALEMPHQSVSRTEIDSAIEDTWAKIRQKPKPLTSRWAPWMPVAAAFLLLLGLGWVLFLRQYREPSGPLSSLAAIQPKDRIRRTNTSHEALPVRLPDGSRVMLSPAASLDYPKRFADAERRVYLKGNAFFEVRRMPAQPFLVITEKLVTRVLGTSFWVKADAAGQESRVIVKTGKVSVFRTNDLLAADGKPKGVVLTPNQQVALSNEDNRLAKSLIDRPILLQPTDAHHPFSYTETPTPQIFQDLSKAYGIDIVYDEEVLKHCQITATLDRETLFEKLDLLCRTIHASYEVIDTQIVIYSKGCN